MSFSTIKASIEHLTLQHRHGRSPKSSRTPSSSILLCLRISQLICSILILTLLIPDLTSSNLNENSDGIPAAYIVAILIAVTSSLLSILQIFATGKRILFVCLSDFVLCVLWAATAGTFGTIFLDGPERVGEKTESMKLFTRDQERMKAVVGFALPSMLLWIVSAVWACTWCCAGRKATKVDDMVEDIENNGAQNSVLTLPRKNEVVDGDRQHAGGDEAAGEEWKTFVGGGMVKYDVDGPPVYTRLNV